MPWLALGGPLLYERVEETDLLPCTVLISGGEDCWLSAMTIASSLIVGYGLSQERVKDGCKST